jgi:hypothetical protein
MQTITIDDLLNHNADPDGEIYVLRDGDCPLYVGKASAGIASRWVEGFGSHLWRAGNGRWRGNDETSNVIVRLMPHSLAWQLDCYTHDEAAKKWMPPYIKEIQPEKLSLDKVEQMCIAALRPCFNASFNPNPRPIPKQIERVLLEVSRNVSRSVLNRL